MSLTPDEIERRTFALEDRGYDRDEVRTFLFEVATALRLGLHTTRPPAPLAQAALSNRALAGASSTVAVGPSAPDDTFDRLGAELAEVLRAAHLAMDSRIEQAEADAAAVRERAQYDAIETRRQADLDAAWQHDRAKRVLIAAQEQAETILAEAEAQAAAVVAESRDEVSRQTSTVTAQARQHAEQILRAERDALRRLHEAQTDLAAAIESLMDSETRPVVDLTENRADVHFGGPADAGEPGEPSPPTAAQEAAAMSPDAALADADPVVRMVRQAVHRAVSGAAQHAADDEHNDRAGGPELVEAHGQAAAPAARRQASPLPESARDDAAGAPASV